MRIEPMPLDSRSVDPRQRLTGAAAGVAGPSRATGSTLLKIVLPIVGLAIAIAVWWWYVVAFEVRRIVLPAPPDVVGAFPNIPNPVENTVVTITQSTIGFGIAAVGGMLIGAVIAHSRLLYQMSYPWLVAFNAVPKVAFAPLLVVWMGFGMQPRIALAVLICFFPVILATVTGLHSTPMELAELARSLDASRLKTFLKVRLPNALPQIFIGLKVALPLAIIGAVLGEIQAGSTGLGAVIKHATYDKAIAFAAIAVLAVISIVMYYLLVAIERMLLPWVKATTAQ